MQYVAADVAECIVRRKGESLCIEPELAGASITQNLHWAVNVRAIGKTRRVETGGRSHDVQRQCAFSGPKAIELPAAQQPLSGPARCPSLSSSERQLVAIARRENVPPVQVGKTLIAAHIQIIQPRASGVVVDRFSKSIRIDDRKTVRDSTV